MRECVGVVGVDGGGGGGVERDGGRGGHNWI